MHKITDRLSPDPEFVYCLMASPQWDQQEDALLPYAFQALNQTRQSMQLHLFGPCPEPQAEPVPAPASQATATKPGEPGAQPGNASNSTLSFMPTRHPNDALAMPAAVAAGVRFLRIPSAGWNRDDSGTKWEISEKLPKNQRKISEKWLCRNK